MDGLIVPFDYDEIFYNTLTRSYEFILEGELIAEIGLCSILNKEIT
jgi:hypothetical protein